MSLPPGPNTPTPLLLLQWIRHPLPMLDAFAARYGDTFRMRFPLWTIIVISHPDDIKTVFSCGPREVAAGAANEILRPFLGSHSLLLLDGDEHLRQRKLLLPPFHGERMQTYGRDMIETTHASIDGWPAATPFALHRPMQSITLEIILRAVFGLRSDEVTGDLARTMTDVLDRAAWMPLFLPWMQKDLGPWSPWRRFLDAYRRGESLLFDEIHRRREGSSAGRADILSLLLEARDEAGTPMSDAELRDQLVTLLSAGHETTATSLSWAMRWILADPALHRRLRDEIASVPLVPEHIAKLELLDATVREALRLVPVVMMVGRRLEQPMRVGGYDLPAGVFVAPNIYLAQRRAASYPNPTQFDPDRFLRNKLGPYEWLPFGGGIRRCIGMAFAMYEMKMVLATVLSRATLRLAPGPEIEPMRRAITMSPSRGMPVILDARAPRPRSTSAVSMAGAHVARA